MQQQSNKTSSLSADKNVKSTTNGIITTTTKSQQNLRASHNSNNNNKVNGSAIEGERINDRFMLKRVNKSNLNRKVSLTEDNDNIKNATKTTPTTMNGQHKSIIKPQHKEIIVDGEIKKDVEQQQAKAIVIVKEEVKQVDIPKKIEVVNTERKIGNKFTVKKVEENMNESVVTTKIPEKKESPTVISDVIKDNLKNVLILQQTVAVNNAREEATDNERDKKSESEAELVDEIAIDRSIDNRFLKFDKVIGRGAFKSVFKGLDTENGVPVAWCELHVSPVFFVFFLPPSTYKIEGGKMMIFFFQTLKNFFLPKVILIN
jgi:hypothetical protein